MLLSYNMSSRSSPGLRRSLWDRLQQQDEDICAIRHQHARERHTLQTQLRKSHQHIKDLQQSTQALRKQLTEQHRAKDALAQDLHRVVSEYNAEKESQSADIWRLQRQREESNRDLRKQVELLITERDDLMKEKLSCDNEIGDLHRLLARQRELLRGKNSQAARANERFKATMEELHGHIEKLKDEVEAGSRLTKKLSKQITAMEQNSDLRAATLQVQLALVECEMDEKAKVIECQNSCKRSYNEIVKKKMATMDSRIAEERESRLKMMQAFKDVNIKIHRLQLLYCVFRSYYDSDDPMSFSPVSVLEASVAYRGFWVKFDELRFHVDKSLAET